MKSIKTKKSLKTNNSNKSKKHITGHHTTVIKLKLESGSQHDSMTTSKNKGQTA